MVSISKTRLHALETAAWMNRAMIALVYIWFGLLKVVGTSPAEGLVTKLFNLTLEPFMGIQTFLVMLGLGEFAIGLLWFFPRLTKIAFWVLIVHLFTTFLPVLFFGRRYLAILFCFNPDGAVHHEKCGAGVRSLVYLCVESRLGLVLNHVK